MRLGVSAAVVGDRLVEGDVVVEEGRIYDVGVGRPSGASIAVPGFVDVHFHGHGGIDFVDADTEDHIRIAKAITSTGVTAYMPTLMTQTEDQLVKALQAHPGEVPDGARALGFHLEGPLLSPEYPGAHRPDLLQTPSVTFMERLMASGPVAQITLAPELDGALAVVGYLVERGVIVSLGHSSADAATTHAALDAGATAFTHVFNAMRPLRHRDPGILGVALSSAAFLTGIFDGVHLSDEAETVLIRCAGDRLVAITDGTAAVGRVGDDGAVLGDQAVRVRDGAPRLPDGTIAGSVLTMDEAFRRLVGVMPLVQAARATSTNPARMVGLDASGLTPGSRADVAILDEGNRVRRTLVGGVEVFQA